MNDFSIENNSKEIYSLKTKEYFQEVLSSYHNNNGRAAIVTLYSVVITDLLEKLEILEDIYSDTTAKAILDETKAYQQANPTNPEWERELIEKVKTRTNLFDNVDYAHVVSLRNDRHLCAHPVINKDDKLYTPSKEVVAAHIRNMMESLFLKPPLLSKKILTTILVDVASKKNILIDDESIEKYVKAKYLINLTSTVEIDLFRELWKFVFKLNDSQSSDNRGIIFKVMMLLYNRNSTGCIEKIKDQKEYFNSILDSDETLKYLIIFFAMNEFLFKEMREDVHLIIKAKVNRDPSAKLVAWFLSTSFTQHTEMLKTSILNNFDGVAAYDAEISAYQKLITIAVLKGFKNEIFDFITWRYSNAKNFNDADTIFDYFIEPNFSNFSKEQFEYLATNSNQNTQTYWRAQAHVDHRKLKDFIYTKYPDFNFEAHSNIFKN